MTRPTAMRLGPWLLGLSFLAGGCTSTAPGEYVLPPSTETSTEEPTAPACQQPANEERLLDELLERVETEREQAGLPPLVLSETLSAVADNYACTMIDCDFFSHVDPETQSSPGQRVMASGYNFISIGENLAAGQRSAADVVQQWMDSPGHRANLLGPMWRETGIAVRSGGDYGVYWVEIFADPVDTAPSEPAAVLLLAPGS